MANESPTGRPHHPPATGRLLSIPLHGGDGARSGEHLFAAYLIEQQVLEPEQLEEAIRLQRQRHLLLGELGMLRGYLQPDGVDRILKAQQTSDRKFGELALEMGLLTPEQLQELLEAQANNHFYLGEALLALGHIRNKDELYQHLVRFKALSSPERLEAAQIPWPGFDRRLIEELIQLTYEFFYNEGFVIRMAGISPALPPRDDYRIYSVTHTLSRKGLFSRKAYCTLSMLLLKSWNHIISRDSSFDRTSLGPSDDVAEIVYILNNLFCKRLRKADYSCKYGPVRSTLPAFTRCLTIRFDTSVEPFFLLFSENS
jgi:hypothetical protein